MTRKDYIRLAVDLGIDRSWLDGDVERKAFDLAVDTMVSAMKRDNHRFDADRFHAAVREQEDKSRAARAAR